MRIVIANFPTIGVDGVEAVIVRFGPGAVGIEVQPSKILSSNEEQTTFVVSAPPMKQPGTVSVSVSVANDPSRIVSSQLRYKARPKPRVTTLIPTRASRLGGDYVSVSLENFPVVASTKEVRVLFGNLEADVTKISVSDVSATVLVVTVPSSDIDGEVLISVSHRKDRTLGAGSAKFTLLGTDPRLAYVYPTEAPVTGGKQVSVRLENILRTYTVSDILVWVAGIRAEVRTVSSTKEKAMNIRFVSPEISNVGVATGVVAVAGVSNTTFDFKFLAASAPAVTFIFPPSAVTLGGTQVLLRVSNLPKDTTMDQLLVRFGRETATLVSVTQRGDGLYPETQVTALVPASKSRHVTLSVQTNDGSKHTSVPYVYFPPCDFDNFCALKGGMETNVAELRARPPRDSSCQIMYCMQPPPPAYVSAVVPDAPITNFGGELLSVKIANFPLVEHPADVRVIFGSKVGEVTAVRLSTEESTSLLLRTPKLNAEGAVAVTLVHLKSARRTSAGFTMIFFREAEGDPAFEDVLPRSALTTGGTRLVIKLSNAAEIANADAVSVLIGGARVPISGFEMTGRLDLSLYLESPDVSAACAGA